MLRLVHEDPKTWERRSGRVSGQSPNTIADDRHDDRSDREGYRLLLYRPPKEHSLAAAETHSKRGQQTPAKSATRHKRPPPITDGQKAVVYDKDPNSSGQRYIDHHASEGTDPKHVLPIPSQQDLR